MTFRKTLAALAAAALAATAIAITPSVAIAAPGDPGTDAWINDNLADSIWLHASLDDSQDDYDAWLAAMNGTTSISCINPGDARVILGTDEHPNPSFVSTRPVVTLTAPSFTSVYDYASANGIFTLDFSASPCVTEWNLDGSWFLTNEGALFPFGGGFESRIPSDDIANGDDFNIVTPTGWLNLANSALAQTGNAYLYLGRTDGTFVQATFAASLDVPIITPTPATLIGTLDEPLTIDLSAVMGTITLPGGGQVHAFPCTISTGDECNPDSVTFGSLPDGATGDVAGPITWTPTTYGTFEFTYALSDSAAGASSAFVTGIIEVTDEAAVPRLSDHAWSIALGESITISAAQLAAGCEWVDGDGEPVGTSCAALVTEMLDALTTPDGAVVATAPDGGGTERFASMTFTPSAAGTYTVTYRAAFDKGYSNTATATITVLAPPSEPQKPIVTG